jgi:cardiolipin synthase
MRPLLRLAAVAGVAIATGCAQPHATALITPAEPEPASSAPAPTLTVEAGPLDAGALAEPLPSLEPASPLPSAPVQSPPPDDAGNAATLYVSPAETLPAVKALIASAKKSIYFETFNFGTSYARQIVPLLAAKARKGVEVKVLIDFVGSRFLKGYNTHVDSLREAGAIVMDYNPRMMTDANGVATFNITHRKLYMADGVRALTGGVNLMGTFETTTQDVLIEWRGPVLGPLYREFAHDWQLAGGDKPAQKPDLTSQGTVDAQVVVTSPDEGRYEIRDAVFAAIDGAEREILIEQQYFWDDALIDRLHAAVKRGVKLKVLVPGGEQKFVQKTCNSTELVKLVADGAEARRYVGPSGSAHLHTKYFDVDGTWAIDGSCNGDTRSLVDNQELDVITTDAGLIKALRERLFDGDWTTYSEPFDGHDGVGGFKPIHSLLDAVDYYF